MRHLSIVPLLACLLATPAAAKTKWTLNTHYGEASGLAKCAITNDETRLIVGYAKPADMEAFPAVALFGGAPDGYTYLSIDGHRFSTQGELFYEGSAEIMKFLKTGKRIDYEYQEEGTRHLMEGTLEVGNLPELIDQCLEWLETK